MADHFAEVVGLRLSRLEARAEAEEQAVKAYFLEQQQFITFSLNRFGEILRSEWRADLTAALGALRAELGAEIASVKTELDGKIGRVKAELGAEIAAVRTELGAEIASVRAELGAESASVRAELGAEIAGVRAELGAEIAGVKKGLDGVGRKLDLHHEATQIALREILDRLPPAGPRAER